MLSDKTFLDIKVVSLWLVDIIGFAILLYVYFLSATQVYIVAQITGKQPSVIANLLNVVVLQDMRGETPRLVGTGDSRCA